MNRTAPALLAKALLTLYVASVLALLAAAGGIWRLRCESFGCMGIGVAWVAWVAAFFVVLGLGLLARSQVASSAGLARIGRGAWWLQVLTGAVHLAIWVGKMAS
ncbi:MAG: hypothetical protein EON92_07955 [Burkholderiales bacterium]|nr:MAG: hypothetical protein EON92_07955 [Burkholderiales bacterium]